MSNGTSDLGVFDSENDDYYFEFLRDDIKKGKLYSKKKSQPSLYSVDDDELVSYYEEATTLSCDEQRFPAKKSEVKSPRPLLELSPEDRRYYKYFRRLHGIRYCNVDYVPLDPKLDPPPRRCFSCWERGHESRACTYPLIVLFCRNCGRRDVDLEDCPRCSRAYFRERTKKDAATALGNTKPSSQKKPDPLLDVSLLVNEGSVAGDSPRRRSALSTIDENEYEFSDDMLSDVKKLMDAVKHLSVKTQDRVLRQWLTERQKN